MIILRIRQKKHSSKPFLHANIDKKAETFAKVSSWPYWRKKFKRVVRAFSGSCWTVCIKFGK